MFLVPHFKNKVTAYHVIPTILICMAQERRGKIQYIIDREITINCSYVLQHAVKKHLALF